MKTWILLVSFLAVGLSASAAPVNVTASQDLRIALVCEGGNDRAPSPSWSSEFQTRYQRAFERLYGQPMGVAFSEVDAKEAVEGLAEARYDAVVVMGERLPRPIKRARYHAIRAMGPGEDQDVAAFLVLRREQLDLDSLLANAFSVAFNSEAVRRAMSGQTFAAAD